MASDYLFSEQFRNRRGMTVDQALAGYQLSGKDLISPDEYAEHMRHIRPNDQPYKERIEQSLSESTPIPEILHSWAMHPGDFFTGDPHRIARDIRDLTNEMNTSSKVNDTTLYRGAKRAPDVDAGGSTPISFTNDPYVARSFAAMNKGKIWKKEAGTVRGLHLPDYVERQRTVGSGRRPEREWLIDPDSIIGRA